MKRHHTRLLALAATTAALVGVTTAPAATAATPPEATVAAYVFTDGTTFEGLTAENGNLTAPHIESGYTPAHPGWDIRLSDEAYAPGLPRQNFFAKASHDATAARADTSGFISLVDNDPSGVPFAVVNLAGRSVSCSVGGPVWAGGGGSPRFWVRDMGDELWPIDIDADGWTSGAAPAGQAGGSRVQTMVKVNRLLRPAQLAAYPQFAKYNGRTTVGAGAYELVITQGAKTYRVLAGAHAASC